MFCPSSDCGERPVSGAGRVLAGRGSQGPTHQLGVLGAHRVGVLQQCLELVILGESDDLQDRTKLGKDLPEERGQPPSGDPRGPD